MIRWAIRWSIFRALLRLFFTVKVALWAGGRPGRWLIIAGIVCALAFVGGIQRGQQNMRTRVPNSMVDSWHCESDGGTNYVNEYTTNPGVYDIHCNDGVTVLGGNK